MMCVHCTIICGVNLNHNYNRLVFIQYWSITYLNVVKKCLMWTNWLINFRYDLMQNATGYISNQIITTEINIIFFPCKNQTDLKKTTSVADYF